MSLSDFVLVPAYFGALVFSPAVLMEIVGISEVIGGIGATFMGTLEVLAVSIADIFDGIVTSFEFAITNLICGIKLLGNFHKCFMYYILDIIGQIMYLPFRIALWAFYTFLNYDLYKTEKDIWDIAYYIDDGIYSVVGFSVAHYPKSVNDTCYNCCRVKSSALVDRGNKINDDIMKTAPNLLIPGINLIMRGGHNIMHPFG